VALLLRISDAARRPAPERAPRPALADASTELVAPPHPDSPAGPGAGQADPHAGPRTWETP